MQIKDPSKITFTSIKKDGCLIHFKYEDEYYLVQIGNMGGEYTLVTKLFKGKNKGHVEVISSCVGAVVPIYMQNHPYCLIRYLKHNFTLSHIDKKHFVEVLEDIGLLEKSVA